LFCEALTKQANAKGRVPYAYRRFIYKVDWRARNQARRPSLRTLVNLCAMQGMPICEALLRPLEAASKPLLDLWSGFHAMPIPQRSSRTRVNDAIWCLYQVLWKLEKQYLPPMECVLRPLHVLRAVARDVDADIYELYEDTYRRQGTPTELLYARKGYDYAIAKISDSRKAGRRRPSATSLARGFAKGFRCDLSVAERYASSALLVDEVLQDALQWESVVETTRVATYTDWLKGQ